MFDKVEIVIRAGNGGGGMVSFRREKFVPLGGPDGGDGGIGGDVVVRADSGTTSLRAFRWGKIYRAANGAKGGSRRRYGRGGADLILSVPAGTVVSGSGQPGEEESGADLVDPGQQKVVAMGGKGGLGNAHFASAANQAPRLAQAGGAGEEKSLILELKLIADVGVIGYPNVGKSSLLASASAAKPKVASYPFTTLEPILGAVEVGHQGFILAEIPGLISGAHLGRGLGHDFLRHIVRTRTLIHLVDGSVAYPVDDMIKVNNELNLFDSALGQKPQMVVVNKVDLPGVRERLEELGAAFSSIGITVQFISAATGEGVSQLMSKVLEMLGQETVEEASSRAAPLKVFHPKPRGARVSVSREGDTLVVAAPELERIVAGTDLADPEARRQLIGQFARTGVTRVIEKAGAKPGDKIRCGNLEWRW
jgi:GTP-binding protein